MNDLFSGAAGGCVQLPHPLAQTDPIEIARRVEGGVRLLFQRFDLHTRRLTRSVVPLAVQPLPVAGNRWEAATRDHFRSGQGRLPLLMFAGIEGLCGLEAAPHPAALLYRLDRYVEFDHAAGTALLHGVTPDTAAAAVGRLQSLLAKPVHPTPGEVHIDAPWQADATPTTHGQRVADIQADIASGTVKGVALSVGLSRATSVDPFDVYRACVAANPSPYGYVLHHGDFALVGSSPLAYLQLCGGTLHLETDAGTRPVGPDAVANDLAEQDLLHNPKDADEHQVVVDAELEALAPIARDGCIHTVVSRQVRRFSHVMHLYSAFQARLAEGLDAVDALVALAPAAAVSGYPKRRALAIARRVEGQARGPYGGAIGLMHSLHDADFAVVIRSLWITQGMARLRVGGKVVAQSEAAAEYAEALSKSRFLVNAVAQAAGPMSKASS